MPEYSMVVKVTQTGADQVTGKINALEKAMTLARDRATQLLTKLNALGSAANITFNLNTSNITSAESSVNDVTQAVEELNNRINQLNTERFQQLNANINTTSTNVNKASGGMGGLGKVLGRVGGMVGSIFAIGQIASWGREAISTASDMERLKNMLTVMVGSADEAANAMGRIKTMEQGIASIDLKSGIESVTAFMRMGNSEDVAEQYTQALGKAVDYYGGTSQQVSQAIAQLEQLSGKTSGFGEDLRSLSNSLPGVKQMLTEAFGVDTVDDINELGVTGRQVVDTLIQKFNELPQVPVGIAGVFAQLKSRMTEVFTNIGNSLAPVIQKIAETFLPVIEKVGTQLSKWIENLSAMPQFEAFFNNIAQVLTNIADMVMSVLGNPAVMELIMNTLNTASRIILKISEFFTEIITKLMSQEDLWNSLTKLGNAVMKIVESLVDLLLAVLDTLLGNEEVLDAICTTISLAADGFAFMFGWIAKCVDKLTEMEKKSRKVSDTILSGFGPLGLTAILSRNAMEKLSKNKGKSNINGEKDLEKDESALSKATEQANAAKETAKSVVENTKKEIEDKKEQGGEEDKKKKDTDNIIDKLNKLLQDFFNAMKDAVDNIRKEAYNRLEKRIVGVTANVSKTPEWNGDQSTISAYAYNRVMTSKQGQQMVSRYDEITKEMSEKDLMKEQNKQLGLMVDYLGQLVGFQQSEVGVW